MLTKLYVKSAVFLDSLKKDERGVTAIEYAIVAVAIAGVVTAVFTGTGIAGETSLTASLQAAFERLNTLLSTGALPTK